MSTNIFINDKYKSSVRIDALDDNYDAFLASVIIHGTLQSTLMSVSRELVASSQRAFTITGPYGSGKSTLAGLLAGILSPSAAHREITLTKLSGYPTFNDSIKKAFGYKNGWGVVKHVCGLSNPAQAITKSIYHQLGIKQTPLFEQLSDADCLIKIDEAIEQTNSSFDGVVLLLDELGKALDYQSSNDSDLYFFQELADIAQRSKSPFIIVGFLHQAFNQYARGKTALVQQEWAKVQGRYRDLSYNPTIDESLILIADSIYVGKSLNEQLRTSYSPLVTAVTDHFPNLKSSEDELLGSLPLDPVVSLLLGPISRRRFSQNERSIFGFLASSERFGFRWFIENRWSEKNIALYNPELLWDYLNSNLGHQIESSPDGKAWLEAQDALYRASASTSELAQQIALIVALLTIFGQAFRLYASKDFILEYFTSFGVAKSEVEDAIKQLEKSSIVIFRKKHNAYFIFQGSDIDVNELITAEIEAIRDGVNWATECKTPSHILASKHYHQTGAMRWATTAFVDSVKALAEVNHIDRPKSGLPFTTFVLIGEPVSEAELKTLSSEYGNHLLSCPKTVAKLKAAAIESIAITKIFKRESRLAHDHVAQKELQSRQSEAKQRILDELNGLFTQSCWYYRGESQEKATLSELTSLVADLIFPKAATVINELVNRSKPSGNANSATNKLMLAMLHNSDKEDLGFEENSFPPEKGIYLSVLKSKGWHQETKFGFSFVSDWFKCDQKDFNDAYAIWQSGFEFIKSQNDKVILSDLYDMWMSAPYGLTSGLCRIYGLALLKSLEGKVAFYDKDSTQSFIFIPELDEVIVEKLHKHAHEVAVRYFEIDTVHTNIVKSIAQASELNSANKENVLELAKHIVQLVHRLPSWVKKTSGQLLDDNAGSAELSKEAKSLRNAALRANDPYKLILEELPEIFSSSTTGTKGTRDVEQLTVKLKAALEELVSQHALLVDVFKKIIVQELNGQFDGALQARANLVSAAAHRASIKEFAQRLSGFIDGKTDIEAVMSVAIGAAERNWTDKHISNGLHEIYSLCRQFRREETFSKLSTSSASKSIGLVMNDDEGKLIELEGFVSKARSQNQQIEMKTHAIQNELDDVPDDQKREILVTLLSQLMLPIGSLED